MIISMQHSCVSDSEPLPACLPLGVVWLTAGLIALVSSRWSCHTRRPVLLHSVTQTSPFSCSFTHSLNLLPDKMRPSFAVCRFPFMRFFCISQHWMPPPTLPSWNVANSGGCTSGQRMHNDCHRLFKYATMCMCEYKMRFVHLQLLVQAMETMPALGQPRWLWRSLSVELIMTWPQFNPLRWRVGGRGAFQRVSQRVSERVSSCKMWDRLQHAQNGDI